MMNLAQLEKNLANTDLNQFKTEPFKLLVKQLYKYQDFKTVVILNRINKLTYKDSTIRVYVDAMLKYLKKGVKVCNASSLYDIIDELKATHAPILTPSISERRKEYKLRKRKSSKTSHTTTPVELQKAQPPKYIEKIPPQYGIRCGDWIRLQPSKEMALGYIECYKVIGDGKPVELVTVDLEVLNDR